MIRPVPESPVRWSRDWLWISVLGAAVFYVILITGDLYLASIPLKILMVFSALLAWLLLRRPISNNAEYPLAIPVLTLALAVPAIWTLIAVLHQGDVLTAHAKYIVQHASRFLYILLYFPLYDLLRQFGDQALWIILGPIVALSGVTISIWIYHCFTGDDFQTTQVLVFKGVIGDLPEGFRVFIGNQVVFILGLGILLSRSALRKPTPAQIVLFTLIIGSTWLSHTRGIWLGLMVVGAVVLFVAIFSAAAQWLRIAMTTALGVVVVLAVALISIVLLGNQLGGLLRDESTNQRVRQAPELLEAFRKSPVLGQGLGATLDSGFKRSNDNPWSFELTYLQILFQMGLIGLSVLIGVVVYSGRRAALRIKNSRYREWMPVAGIAAATGLLMASVTNPYLFSSFGMLVLAVSLTLMDPPSVRELDLPDLDSVGAPIGE